MTFSTLEISRDDGMPLELYRFSYTGNLWCYTTAPVPVTYLGEVYQPIPVKRGDLQPTSDINKTQLEITLPSSATIGNSFRVAPPSEPVIITIFGEHFLDNSFTVAWKGRILGAEWTDKNELKLTSENIFSSLLRTGLRRRCQAQCPFVLYGVDCGVERDDYRDDTVVVGIDGVHITASAAFGKIDSWYAGGYAIWTNNVNLNIEKRMIRASDESGLLTLSNFPVGLAEGQDIKIYAGCSHVLEDDPNGCVVKFNNFKRYGGIPYTPSKNPFRSSIF